MKFRHFAFIPVFLLFAACVTTGVNVESPVKDVKKDSSISLLFAGDIMAHTPNFKFKEFDRIWADVKDLVSSADLAFANIEAPVAENIEWSSYPSFNMHQDYIKAAVDAGFDVFSLANNHSNDQLKEGIVATKQYFDSLKSKNVYGCGLKSKSKGPLTFHLIEKNGYKILFAAITQLLNRPDYNTWIDYYPSTAAKKKQLKDDLNAIKQQNNHDLFVLSVHCDDPEYVTAVTDERKKFYKELVEECGINIVWANHPHVIQEWELLETDRTNGQALIMYANGNTISAQRTNPQFSKPETNRDFTGDGVFVKVTLSRNEQNKIKINGLEPTFITTYKAPTGQYVIRILDDDLIHSLERSELTQWAKYLKARKNISEKTRGPRIWQ